MKGQLGRRRSGPDFEEYRLFGGLSGAGGLGLFCLPEDETESVRFEGEGLPRRRPAPKGAAPPRPLADPDRAPPRHASNARRPEDLDADSNVFGFAPSFRPERYRVSCLDPVVLPSPTVSLPPRPQGREKAGGRTSSEGRRAQDDFPFGHPASGANYHPMDPFGSADARRSARRRSREQGRLL